MSPPVEAAMADQVGVPEQAAAEDAPVLEHAYDGIREYDNPLPGWWRLGFWASIVFAAGYLVWFHVAGWGTTPDERYRADLAAYQSQRAVREAEDSSSVTEELLATAAKGGVVEQGAQVFSTRCASCHGPDGRGVIGPNLTDLYQLHGSTRLDLFTTVKNGVPGTAMPAWGEQLPPGDVFAAATFVSTLRGKNVPGGKAPQGASVKPFE